MKASVYKAMGFPVREGQLGQAFSLQLRDAYKVDYHRNIVVTTNWAIKWWKKVSFGDWYVGIPRRLSLTVEHMLKVHTCQVQADGRATPGIPAGPVCDVPSRQGR